MEKQRQRMINLFRIADQTIKRSISKKVEDTGVYRSQHRLLMILGKHSECSQTELAEMMDISPAAVAVSLKKLEKAGYVSRQCHQDDNRVNQLAVTPKGWKLIDISIEYFKEMEEAFFGDFSQEELEQLESYFTRIIKNGENYYESLLKQEK